jgi:CRISPR/Cas system-associated exonuclease Cas4 (RecB family)
MTKAYKCNELDMDFDIPIGDGKVATISGRLDMYDWKTKTIIDLKTTRDVYSQAECGTIPKKEDMLQIQCYGTIFSNTIPVENLVLVYADLNEMIAFKVACEDKTWWLKERILELNRSLIYDNPPQKEISKMCNLCKYRNQCKPDSPTTLSYDNMTTSCIENGELIK